MTPTPHVDREDLMAWLDAEVPPVRALEIDGHVATCVECQSTADDLRAVSTSLAAWTVEAPPPALVVPRAATVAPALQSSASAGAVRILAAWVRPRWRQWTWRQWASPLGAATAVVLFLMIGMIGLQRTAGPAPASSDRSGIVGGVAGGGAQRSAQHAASSTLETAPASPLPQIPNAPEQSSEAPMIARTATIQLTVDRLDALRVAIERLARDAGGAIAALSVSGEASNQHLLSATVRVPAARLDAALVTLRALGQVRHESQESEDITTSHRDLAIRIANARVEEQRLSELLARRTGDLSDVLAVEREQSRVRGEIERMAAEERAMRDRAALSTITIAADERYRAEIALGPMPVPSRLKNALVEGVRDALDSLVGVALGLLQLGPTVAVWLLMFAPPLWLWRRRRARRRTA